MNDELIIEEIIEVPKIYSKKCIYFIKLAYIFLNLWPFVISLFMLIININVYLVFMFTLLFFILNGIIQSKLRVNSIPIKQLERSYSTTEVLKWFFAKKICDFKNSNIRKDKGELI